MERKEKKKTLSPPKYFVENAVPHEKIRDFLKKFPEENSSFSSD